jgi:hypothetical protein
VAHRERCARRLRLSRLAGRRGGAAEIAAVIVLLFRARNHSPRRVAALLLGLALLVAGTYSVLRGFGVGVERPQVGRRGP